MGSTVSGVLSDIDNNLPTVEDYGDYEQADIDGLITDAVGDEEALDLLYDTAVDAGGFRDIVEQSGVVTSGAVSSICAVVMGEMICLDFEPFESFLDLLGGFFLAICYMASLFIVLRG